MDEYDVYASDGAKAGHVVGERPDALVVETGTVFKSRHLVPRAFVEIDEAEGVVRSTLSKEMILDSPKLDGDDVDEAAVASHYGLAGAEPAPPTAGYGATDADDPARTADQQALRDGVEPAEQRRARTRERMSEGWTPGPSGGPIVGGEGDVERG